METFEWKFEKTPKFIQLETTIVCQAKCYFCPQNGVTRTPKFMPLEMIDSILSQTKGLGIVFRPFILNEPFADKRMVEIVNKIKADPTAKVEFNTNGEFVTEKISEGLLAAGVDFMRFSVDGITKKTFDETRGINFDKVYHNVQYFLKRAQETKHHCHIELRMIKLPGTEQEQKEYEKFWTTLGANVVFTKLYRYPWQGQTEAINKPCFKILDEMFIYVSGEVTLCCWDSNERAVVGDLKKESLLDIWNGPKLNEYRKLLANGQRDKILLCSRCDAFKDLDFSKVKNKSGNAIIWKDYNELHQNIN